MSGDWAKPQYRQVHIVHRTMALKMMRCAAHRRRGGVSMDSSQILTQNKYWATFPLRFAILCDREQRGRSKTLPAEGQEATSYFKKN